MIAISHIWSRRARRALRQVLGPDADLSQPEIVAQASEIDLRGTLGCGEITLRAIQSWLVVHGTSLVAAQPRAGFRNRGAHPFEPHSIDVEIGLRIRHRRRELHLGPAELGAQLGVNHQQMQKYESGRIRISVARLYQIAHALRVPIGFFLDEAAAASFVTTGTPRNCEAVIRRSPGYSGDTDLEAPQSPSKILRFAEFLQLHFREGPHAQEAAMLVTIMLIGGLSGASKESSFADFVSFVLKNDLAEYLNAIMKRGSRLPVVAHAWLVDYQSWPAAKKTAIIAAATNGLTALQTLIELLNTKWALRH